MDLGFFRRAQSKFASRSAASLDYGVLVATLAAIQSASATARAARGFVRDEPPKAQGNPLVELLLGGAGWREAAIAQRGCFNPARAAIRSNNT